MCAVHYVVLQGRKMLQDAKYLIVKHPPYYIERERRKFKFSPLLTIVIVAKEQPCVRAIIVFLMH